ncbi:MAG TPA: VWA domain-containing protein [Spirochaetota bacterium]|nr:VWA domain-containing protein [Spirochaetota bacterium]HRZ27365.1 VWA domain-containing protein [Spirochaetota bacterium]HSA13879.1 VWA domain-containing protein [Spirochaetota bacterium]
MGLGNYKYIIYVSLVSFAVLALYVLYLFWRRRALKLLLKNSRVRESLVRGSAAVARAREALIILSILLFAFIFLRPQWGEEVREVNSEGSDVLIALDVSNSMLARDVQPSRLQRAKDAVRWIAESLQGDRIGLVLFAGDAFLQCPLTNDIPAFMMFLDAADPSAIRLQGTDIGRALAEAYRVFEKKRLTSRMLVLITDGEDHEGSAEEAAALFRDLNVSVYSVGIGRDEGEVIPANEDEGSGDNYQHDSSGKLVRTSVNPGLLKKLAAMTGGSYIDITRDFSGLRFILEIIGDQQKNKYGSRIVKERKDRYQIFALILALILAAELALPERESGKRKKSFRERIALLRERVVSARRRISRLRKMRAGRILPIFLLSLLFIAWLDPYRDEVSKGNSLFHEKKYPEAKNHYRSAEKFAPSEQDKDRLSFNRADADYMTGDYDSAIASFQKSIQSGDREVQKKAFFNMGNVYLKQEKYREAVAAYMNALKIDPGYDKAKKNIEYILKKKQNDQKQKDEGKDNKEQDRNGDQQKEQDQEKQQKESRKQQARRQMNREQMKNILKELQNKPVQRRKEQSNERENLEKNW